MSKLIAIQKDLKVLKTEINSFGGYNYRTTEGILLALKPLLVKHECELTISDDIRAVNEHVYIEARATLKCEGAVYNASSFGRDPIVQKGMNAPQATNSASSFARKQCLSGLFLLDDTATVILSKDEQEDEENKPLIAQKDIDGIDSLDELKKYYTDNKSEYSGFLEVFTKACANRKEFLLKEEIVETE